jgi:hypothetical protein
MPIRIFPSRIGDLRVQQNQAVEFALSYTPAFEKSMNSCHPRKLLSPSGFHLHSGCILQEITGTIYAMEFVDA